MNISYIIFNLIINLVQVTEFYQFIFLFLFLTLCEERYLDFFLHRYLLFLWSFKFQRIYFVTVTVHLLTVH